MIIHSILHNLNLVLEKINKQTVRNIRMVMSTNTLLSTGKGEMTEADPSTKSMLKILLPTILPSAISLSFFHAAVTDVTNSGSDVPIAIIVNPTNVSLIPNE